MNILAQLSKYRKKYFPIKRLLWLVPALIALFIGTRFVIIFVKWQYEKDTALEKLVKYKQQIDELRNPIDLEEKGSDISLGAVAIPSKIYDINGKVIGEFFTERRTLLPIEKMPKYLPKALIASEDRKFFEHAGLNYTAILRAMIVNVLSLRFSQGGSTLTQQLAKVLFTNQERTIDRKIFEVFCVNEIEKRYTKNEILEMYLNLIFLGKSNYGFESAAGYLFGKSAANLSLGEASMIVGMLPNPTVFSPLNNLDLALKRQSLVLNSMTEMGIITSNQKKSAISRFKRRWNVRKQKEKLISDIGDFPDSAYKINLAPFFLDHVRNELIKQFDFDTVTKGGLRIYTTLDYNRQRAAAAAMKRRVKLQKDYYRAELKKLKKKRKTKKVIKKIEELNDAIEKTNGAFVSIDPQTGYILALIGGNEFSTKNQFNRAFLAKRQVGSLMKPFVYYTAIAQKEITPATIIEDEPLKIGDFSFENYDNKFLGKITAVEALKQSRNIPALKVMQLAGIDEFRDVIGTALNLSSSEINKRIPREIGVALGTPVFTPHEIAMMFSAMLNKGIIVSPRSILKIEDSQGRLIWQAEPPEEREVFDSTASFIVLSMLQKIFEKGGTAGWVAAQKEANPDYLDFQIAGKTGTTSDFKDAWFAGLTSDEAAVLWIGNDMNTSLGDGRSGGSLCSPAWVEYIRAVRTDNKPSDFGEGWQLEDITKENFCSESGGVPRKEDLCEHIVHDQVFYEGTEPRYFCPLHKDGESGPPLP